MAIFKGFRVQAVDGLTPDANVLYEATGPIVLAICNKLSGSISTNTYTNPDPSLMGFQYTDEPENLTGLCIPTENSGYEEYVNEILRFLPLTVPKAIGLLDRSIYIRLISGTGAYAVSGSLQSGSSGSGYFTLFDPSGVRIGSGLWLDWWRSTNQSTFSAVGFIGTYNGDTVESVTHRIVVESTTAEVIRVKADTNPFNIETTTFLNMCSQYVPPPTDPYSQGGESDTGGGTGNFDGTSVDVDFASLPTLSAVDTGFISLYNPTLAQLQSLANYMWSDLFDLDTFKKLFGDPMQAILGLSIVPGPVPSSGAQVVKVGNISTGINMNKAASQYIDVDCGTLNVEEFWGAYLDYEPYTKAEIYLPYIGTHQIAVDDIMGKPVHIKYHIDILSGGCACEIKCGGSVLYTFIGSCAVSIPVTGSDWTNLLNGVLSAASAVGTMVATGGAAAPAAAGEIASAAVNSLKPNIEKSGSVSGSGGLMAGKVPVLILTRPRQALPTSQNEYTGYPAFITRSLGAVSGYTEVHKIRLGGISATEAELDEIENLLKGGVIL